MIRWLFSIFVFIVIGYSLFLVAVPYYHYYAFESDLKEILKVSVTDTPEEVMTKILDIVRKYKIPVGEEDIILLKEKGYTVKVSWHETVDFFNIYQKTFEFSIDTSK
jgi:hypothetical protein